MNLVIARHSFEQISPLYPEISKLYQGMVEEISLISSPQHAFLFAKPQIVKESIYWYADGKEVVPWKSLSEAKQKKALRVIQSILVDITCAAHLYPHSILSRSLPYCGCFPSLDHIYIIDGRPVITAWGYSGINGFYNPLTNETGNISWETRRLIWSKFPWVTALTALFAGLLAALLWNIYHHSGKACYATYPAVKEVEDALKEQGKNKNLNQKQDDLLRSLELLRKQCKIPPVQPLKSQETPELSPLPEPPKLPELPAVPKIEPLPNLGTPQKQEVSPPKPEKKADLPKDAWDKKDKSMLNGCWHLTTPLKLVARGTNIWTPVQTWKVCFNQSGGGSQTITKADKTTCRGPISAYFQGEQLIIRQPANCDGSFFLVQGTQTCTRLNDREARCLYKDDDFPNGKGAIGIFKR